MGEANKDYVGWSNRDIIRHNLFTRWFVFCGIRLTVV